MNRTRRARVETLVRTVFGLSAFRPGQQSVLDAVLSKQLTVAIMPTAAGKSLCYRQWAAVEGHRRTLATEMWPMLGSDTHPRVV